MIVKFFPLSIKPFGLMIYIIKKQMFFFFFSQRCRVLSVNHHRYNRKVFWEVEKTESVRKEWILNSDK